MSLVAQIKAHLEAHPTAKAAEIAKAIGESEKRVKSGLKEITSAGIPKAKAPPKKE